MVTKLDIGCGDRLKDGFTAWDIKQGCDARRLVGIADGQLDEIRAIHVLEHISFRETLDVVREWSRALKLGGILWVAVPNIDKIIKAYDSPDSDGFPIEGWLMGGHTDEHDAHHAIFNPQKLVAILGMAGLKVECEFQETGTCAGVPISLNLKAVKIGRYVPPPRMLQDTVAIMSMPRVAWTETMASAAEACRMLQMPFVKTTGVFWGQCLERGMTRIIKEKNPEWILTIDFDSLFDEIDILALREIADASEFDVVCPLQIGRDRNTLIVKPTEADGTVITELERDRLRDLIWPVQFGHFGLTMIRASALAKLPHPWFKGEPDENGEWSDGRMDDDIWFWKRAAEHGLKIGTTPRVRIGHLQLVGSWLDANLAPVHQYLPEYHEKGRPV